MTAADGDYEVMNFHLLLVSTEKRLAAYCSILYKFLLDWKSKSGFPVLLIIISPVLYSHWWYERVFYGEITRKDNFVREGLFVSVVHLILLLFHNLIWTGKLNQIDHYLLLFVIAFSRIDWQWASILKPERTRKRTLSLNRDTHD